MIGFLEGTVAGRFSDGCFVDVGGVGYRLTCSGTTLAALPPDGRRCRLWTHLHVREDALSLFGFASEAEQRLFEALLSVSGVGPRVAVGVCSAFTPEAFKRVLVSDDVSAVASVAGVGKKTAQRIVLDLKERFDLPDLKVAGARPDALAQARSALENLGYSPPEVRAALNDVAVSEDDAIEEVVKSALKTLALGGNKA